MSRYIGNYLRVPSSEPQQASAPGIWSLSEQLNYQRANVWPPARDPYYNQTVLHLSGDVAGTRETNPVTQPRTFLSDASSNNFLLTPNGDVSARPFNPYLNSYSNYFSGSPYLSVADAASLNFAGDFTVECWVYITGGSGARAIVHKADTNVGYEITLLSGNNITVSCGSLGVTGTTTLPNNQWVHVAIVRSGVSTNNFKLYVNGNQDGQGTNTSSTGGSVTLGIGAVARAGAAGVNPFTGYISNVRISSSAIYTAPFPSALPSSPLTASASTSLLTCIANRFIDINSSPKTITVNGTPAVSQNSPFVSYDTTNGSGYFDGNLDYLTAPSNIVDFAAGQAFTVECWVYVSSNTPAQAISANGANAFSLVISGGQVLYGKSGVIDLLVGTMAAANQWVHVAVGRNSSNTSRLWVNGTSVATSGSDTYSFNAATTYIGANSNPGAYLNGYMASLRVVKGTDVYGVTNTNITVPTAPLTPVSGTSLLTLQTRAPANNQGILDTSPNSLVVTRTGNVAQGSFSPFSQSGWSNYFNGSSGLSLGTSDTFVLDTNFTMEVFIYPTSGSVDQYIAGYMDTGLNTAWDWYLTTSNQVIFRWVSTAPTVYTVSGSVSINAWTYIAITLSGTLLSLYINGAFVTSTTVAGSARTSGTRTLGIGQTGGSYTSNRFNGYISNFRYIRGTALSVSSTPATQLTTVSGTSLLICQSNRFRDASPNNFTITTSGSPSVQPFSPFAPTQAYVASQLGGSAYFDGNDYLSLPDSDAWHFGTGDFTVESWYYPTTTSAQQIIIGQWSGSVGGTGLSWVLMTSNDSNVYLRALASTDGSGVLFDLVSTSKLQINAWNHVVLVRSGSTFQLYINGATASSGSTTSASALYNSPNILTIGSSSAGAQYVTGFVSGVRVIKGTAAYFGSTYLVPTAPPLPTPNTSLLLNFTGAGIVDATGKNVVETVGNSAVQTTQSRWPPGSLYFDGTGDWLQLPASDVYAFGSGDYTVEAWVYFTSINNTNLQIIFGSGAAGGNSFFFSVDVDQISVGTSAAYISNQATSFTTGQWYHVVACRSNTTLRLFVNGTQAGSNVTDTTNWTSSGNARVGANSIGTQTVFGYIQDLRITKGYARYVTGTGANANQMVFNGTNTLALSTRPFPLA